MLRRSEDAHHNRKHEEREKRQDLTGATGRNSWQYHQNPDKDNGGDQQRKQECNRHNLSLADLRGRGLLTVFTQVANVLDQILDLIIGKLLVIRRHLVLAFFGDLKKLGVTLLADLRRAKVFYPKFLAHRSSAGSIRPMASCALALVERPR